MDNIPPTSSRPTSDTDISQKDDESKKRGELRSSTSSRAVNLPQKKT